MNWFDLVCTVNIGKYHILVDSAQYTYIKLQIYPCNALQFQEVDFQCYAPRELVQGAVAPQANAGSSASSEAFVFGHQIWSSLKKQLNNSTTSMKSFKET